MTTPLHNSLEEAYAELNRQRAALHETQRRLTELGATVTSPNRAVSVTVDHQGAVSEIKFLTSGYRGMAPAELGALLVETIAQARTEITGQVAEVLGQLMPGRSMLDALTGEFDLDEIMDEALAEATAAQEYFDVLADGDSDDSDPAAAGGPR